jgi:hypothetical protein
MSAESTQRTAVTSGIGFWKSVTWATFLIAGAISMFDPLELFSYSVTPVSRATAEHNGKPNEAMMPPGASATTDKEDARFLSINDRMHHKFDLRDHGTGASARICHLPPNLKKSLVGATAARHT